MAKLRNLTDLQKLSLDIVKGKVEKYSMTERHGREIKVKRAKS